MLFRNTNLFTSCHKFTMSGHRVDLHDYLQSNGSFLNGILQPHSHIQISMQNNPHSNPKLDTNTHVMQEVDCLSKQLHLKVQRINDTNPTRLNIFLANESFNCQHTLRVLSTFRTYDFIFQRPKINIASLLLNFMERMDVAN